MIGFIPFPRVLVLGEMQSDSSRVWTRVTVSISYDNNHYITGTSTEFKPVQLRLKIDLESYAAWGEGLVKMYLIWSGETS